MFRLYRPPHWNLSPIRIFTYQEVPLFRGPLAGRGSIPAACEIALLRQEGGHLRRRSQWRVISKRNVSALPTTPLESLPNPHFHLPRGATIPWTACRARVNSSGVRDCPPETGGRPFATQESMAGGQQAQCFGFTDHPTGISPQSAFSLTKRCHYSVDRLPGAGQFQRRARLPS